MIQHTDPKDRQAWLSLLAKADPAAVTEALGRLGDLPQAEMLRAPEIGGVMVRGRIGGTGQSFNLGEMTVARCSLRLASGAVGHGYVQGRDMGAARAVALIDAMMQGPRADDVRAVVLAPLEAAAQAKARARAEKAAATKVEFFTMVRGEDQ